MLSSFHFCARASTSTTDWGDLVTLLISPVVKVKDELDFSNPWLQKSEMEDITTYILQEYNWYHWISKSSPKLESEIMAVGCPQTF